jgi:hypothetical protein
MRKPMLWLLSILATLSSPMGQWAWAYDTPTRQTETPAATDKRQYTFAWQFLHGSDMAPRGGTTTGAAVELVKTPTAEWRRLQESGLDKKEKDRRAILAMAGPYRTSFDFIETVGFKEGYQPAQPYQSWGTEYVYVVANEPDFVSLQHILLMRMVDEEGEVMEPMVVKHWRQDWRYQQREFHTFRGHRTWERDERSRREVKGRWVQSVYQVDDTPRYQAVGDWEHFANYSSWRSEETWRPLPRREFSVRDDYQVLIGTNRHTITPTGWVQEEENLKVVLDDRGNRVDVLARENGLARYERIANYDWTASDEYWQRTGPFWGVVRETWDDIFRRENRFVLEKSADGTRLFMAMFDLADITTENAFDPATAREKVDATLAKYLRHPTGG